MKFLFDLGGVFFDWDPYHFYKNVFKDPVELEYFLENVCNDDWNIKQDKGRLIKEAEIQLIDIFPKYKNEIRMYYKNHHQMFKGLFYKSIEALNILKSRNYECYVLSNWSAETFRGMKEKYHFLELFDGMIISGNEKMIKPSKEIYILAIKRFNLIPKETVFIDDKIENINSAKSLNFNTIYLQNPELIIEKINKYIYIYLIKL